MSTWNNWLVYWVDAFNQALFIVLHVSIALPVIDFDATQHFIKLVLQRWWEHPFWHHSLACVALVLVIYITNTIAAHSNIFELSWAHILLSHVKIVLVIWIRLLLLEVSGLSNQRGCDSLSIRVPIGRCVLEVLHTISRLTVVTF